MTPCKQLGTVLLVLTMACTCSSAREFIFRVNDGTWDVPGNWEPPDGPPGAGDAATILTAQTCRIVKRDEAAQVIRVQTGARLEIIGRELRLGDPHPGNSTIDGTVVFKKVGEAVGTLRVVMFVDLAGTGLLDASKANGPEYEGRIINGNSELQSITIERGVLMKGSFEILLAFETRDVLLVDHPSDETRLGRLSDDGPRYAVFGSSTFRVTAGTLRWGRVAAGFDVYPNPSAEVTGTGTMHFTTYFTETATPPAADLRFLVSGGTLKIDASLKSRRGLTFSGGRIELAAGRFAEFESSL